MHPAAITVVGLLCVVSFAEVLTDKVNDTSTLQCYKCADVKLEKSNPTLKKNFSGESDQWCEHPSSDDATETCQTDYACGCFKGSISFDVPSVGTSKVTVKSRGCMKVHINTVLNKCKPIGSDSERNFAGEVLSVLSEVSDVEVYGNVCACGTDHCDTTSKCSGVAIGTLCVSRVVFGISIAILCLLVITGFCCCCCCGCCRKDGKATICTLRNGCCKWKLRCC